MPSPKTTIQRLPKTQTLFGLFKQELTRIKGFCYEEHSVPPSAITTGAVNEQQSYLCENLPWLNDTDSCKFLLSKFTGDILEYAANQMLVELREEREDGDVQPYSIQYTLTLLTSGNYTGLIGAAIRYYMSLVVFIGSDDDPEFSSEEDQERIKANQGEPKKLLPNPEIPVEFLNEDGSVNHDAVPEPKEEEVTPEADEDYSLDDVVEQDDDWGDFDL